MPPAQEKHEFIMQEAATFLAPEGFRRSGRCFHKLLKEAGVRWTICSQKNRYSTAEEVSFTFNISTEWKRRPASSEDWEPQTTWYGGVGGRIGDFMPQKQDTWWTVNQTTSAKPVSDEVNAVLASCVLPFFRQFQTEQDIKNYLRACEKDTMRHNYPHAITMLEFDLQEKKGQADIERRIRRIRLLGKVSRVDKAVTEATLQRVLKAYGYSHPLPEPAPRWKFWA